MNGNNEANWNRQKHSRVTVLASRLAVCLTGNCESGNTLICPIAKMMGLSPEGPDSLMVYRAIGFDLWVVFGELGKACAI